MFVLVQNLKQLLDDATVEAQVTTIAKRKIESVNRFAPEQENYNKSKQITGLETKQKTK